MKKFVSIVVNDEYIYGVKVMKEKKKFTILNKERLKRTNSVSDDIAILTKQLNEPNTGFGIVQVTQPQTKLITTSVDLDYLDIKELINARDPQFLVANPDKYYHQFSIKPVDNYSQMVYVVALPKDIVKVLAKGVLLGNGTLELIDYWPFSIQYPRNKYKYTTNIIESEEGITGYVWAEDVVIAQYTKRPNESPATFLGQLATLSGVDTLQEYPLSVHLKESISKEWQELIAQHPKVKHLPCLDDTKISLDSNETIFYEAAIGMAYRWLHQ